MFFHQPFSNLNENKAQIMPNFAQHKISNVNYRHATQHEHTKILTNTSRWKSFRDQIVLCFIR